MSTNFNAFQLPDKPEISTNREHVRLEKSITLPHNTIKYFGFHILKGAEVVITFCSRYDGSQLAIVQGGKKLETCELQDYNKNKVGPDIFEYTAKIGNRSAATENESSSTSSFEKSLFDCYKESIEIPQSPPLPSSETCTSTDLIKNGAHMSTRSKFIEGGFYYYMFYSDNDLVQNDIHAIFEIYKPTFQYSNSTDTSKSCLNSTNCTLPISFLSNEIVVVEVPIRDGIQHGDHDNYLVSTCHPRMAVYAIFPISMLVLLLSYLFFCLVRLRSRKERNPTPS